MREQYQPPVARLLTLGEEFARLSEWPDYPAGFGLDASHVPALIRMATDPELYSDDSASKEGYAVLHAWRALG